MLADEVVRRLCKDCGGVISRSRLRPDCLHDSMTPRWRRLIAAAVGSATERVVVRGTRESVPSSVIFSISHFWRSPFGSATARVTTGCWDVLSVSFASRCSVTLLRSIHITVADHDVPWPSNNSTRSPVLTLITRERCRASSPSIAVVSSVGVWERKNRWLINRVPMNTLKK